MKILLSVAAIALTITTAYAAPPQQCHGRYAEACYKAQERRINALQAQEDHRKWMQGHIDVAVEHQKEADEIINRNRLTAPDFIMLACREDAIYNTVTRFGYMKTPYFSNIYRKCISDAGVNP